MSSQYLIYAILAIVIYSIFSGYNLRNKIYCTFRTRDKTKVYKWVKAIDGYRIEWGNGWYYIDIKRCVLAFKWVGILPLWVRTLDFRFDASKALDPETFDNAYESPEERKALNVKDDMQAANQGSQRALAPGGKVSGMFGGGLMPILMIGGILLSLYFSYTAANRTDKVGVQGNATQIQIQDVQKSVNSLQQQVQQLLNK